jgi:hypothetical protein
MKNFFKIFGLSFGVSFVALIAALLYGGPEALILALLLGVMEVSLSFDNSIVNARVLEKMSEFWQKIFLTVGILVAVFFMRLVMPLLLVSVTTGLNFVEVINLALAKGDPEQPGTYGHYLHDAHPQIAAFGGMFLFLLFLNWLFEVKDIKWLTWIEHPLEKIGQLKAVSFLVALAFLLVGAALADHEHQANVLIAGIAGIITYVLVDGLGSLFEGDDEDEIKIPGQHDAVEAKSGQSGLVKATGRAAFFLFIYLEVLDASFSFDGVVSAFAITADPIIIALGLGFIGAIFVRSITIFLVRQGTLNKFVYLDHGAHWAIGALAGILIFSIGFEIPEVVTGLIGVALIVAAFISSHIRNKKIIAAGGEVEKEGVH